MNNDQMDYHSPSSKNKNLRHTSADITAVTARGQSTMSNLSKYDMLWPMTSTSYEGNYLGLMPLILIISIYWGFAVTANRQTSTA
jgi:hypothetical protein